MKKQLITIISVALAAILLFVAYSVFFDGNDDITTTDDPYTTISDELRDAVSAIDGEIELKLLQYDPADSYWEWVYLCCDTLSEVNGGISLSTDKGGDFKGISIKTDKGSKDIKFDSLFKMKYTTKYAYNGWSVICNALFELYGMPAVSVDAVVFQGFNADGDSVIDGNKIFVFPAVERSDIAYLTIYNDHGDYSVYQDKNGFYFSDSRAVTYNDEAFSLMTTNCRYPVAYGTVEIPEGKSWADYGLNVSSDSGSTLDEAEGEYGVNGNAVSYTLVTVSDDDGVYYLHTVVINKTAAASGGYHYARYIGGVFRETEEEGSDELISNLSSDKIYLVPATTAKSVMQSSTDLMQPTIVNAITDTNKLFEIGDIRIDHYDEGISAAAKNILSFVGASNLSAADPSALTKVIGDKAMVSDYGKYADAEKGWQSSLGDFAGFSSSDGKATYIIGSLAKQAETGEYKVSFGLLRDEKNGAYLPTKVTLEKSYDGRNWHEIENGSVLPDHKDKSMGRYEISFTDASVVTHVRISFGVPQKAYSYVVFDEIRIFADGMDAQPANAITGRWKLVAPDAYIPTGYNYAYVDMTNFNNYVQWFSSLEGEKVVDYGFCEDGDASPAKIKTELLAKYGLDKPNRHYSYEYDGVITDLYVSAPDEDGIYYAYSTFTGEVEGESVIVSTDVIVQLTTATAKWLDWGFVEFIDHSLLSLYINDIDSVDITHNGEKHSFDLTANEDKSSIISVSYKGESYDVKSFSYIYQAILSISMQDEYIPEEGVQPVEFLRIKINSETTSPEIVFYKVTATRCCFTVDGEGSYYAHTVDVNGVIDRLNRYIAGEIISK